MRRHLYHSLTKGILNPFPVKKRLQKSSGFNEYIDVHCYCRMPELKDVDMMCVVVIYLVIA